MGIHEYYANMAANCRRGHWYCANLTTVKKAMTKERLMNSAQKLFAKVYEQAQQAGAGAGPNMGGANAGNAGSSKPDDDVVDADFKEV